MALVDVIAQSSALHRSLIITVPNVADQPSIMDMLETYESHLTRSSSTAPWGLDIVSSADRAGSFVTNHAQNSPAASAQPPIQKGDFIVGLINDAGDRIHTLFGLKHMDVITTLKGARNLQLKVLFASAESVSRAFRNPARDITIGPRINASLGIGVSPNDSGLGARITELVPNSVADRAGVAVGDRICKVNALLAETVAHDEVIAELSDPGAALHLRLLPDSSVLAKDSVDQVPGTYPPKTFSTVLVEMPLSKVDGKLGCEVDTQEMMDGDVFHMIKSVAPGGGAEQSGQ